MYMYSQLLLQLFLMHFVGPIASMLMTRYGGHLVCMSGAIMATVGLLAASYVNNIPLLILFYSVLTGLGFGLMYIPSIVACVPYFTRNRWRTKDLMCRSVDDLVGTTLCRSLAIGICLCGIGSGTFALAPISNMILEKYGWRNVMRQGE